MMRSAVVLCSYNGHAYLTEQLRSLTAQTRPPDLWVLSDDASSDDSFEQLTAFAEQQRRIGARVELHRNASNLGYVRHFEQALAAADADVLFCCDQDDVWHPDKLSRMLPAFEADPRLLVLHSDAVLVDAHGARLGKTLFDVLEISASERTAMDAGRAFDVLLRRNIVTGAAMALRRQVLQCARPFAQHWAHDEWISLVASMHGRVAMFDAPLIEYRQHAGNQLGVRERDAMQRLTGIGGGRRAYLQRMQLRCEELEHFVRQSPGSPVALAAVRERLRHARSRAALPGLAPWSRVATVWREWHSGRYGRFANGVRSALVDLAGID